MRNIPSVVSDYLRNHSPKGGFVGYWVDQNNEYNVLVLHLQNDELRFSVGVFPKVVGHWGHQLSGADCSVDEIKGHLDSGLWNAGEAIKERIRTLIHHIESGLDADEVVAICHTFYDHDGLFGPFKPSLPLRGPRLTNEAQFRFVSDLLRKLAHENADIAKAAAERLKAMGITEDNGPLFARTALQNHRKRRT